MAHYTGFHKPLRLMAVAASVAMLPFLAACNDSGDDDDDDDDDSMRAPAAVVLVAE